MKIKFYKILFLMLFLPTIGFAQKPNLDNVDFVKKITKIYGIDNFLKVKSIEFTFNVKFKNIIKTRKWLWEIKKNKVTYWGPNPKGKQIKYVYDHKKLNKQNKVETTIDSRFINDQYWLLFPFHLVWDKKAKITDKKLTLAPISNKYLRCLVVTYPKEAGGYTPGDIYELYLGKDNLIKEWIYRPGGSTKIKYPISWEKYINFNGILISTEHIGKAKDFKLWFSDISVILEE